MSGSGEFILCEDQSPPPSRNAFVLETRERWRQQVLDSGEDSVQKKLRVCMVKAGPTVDETKHWEDMIEELLPAILTMMMMKTLTQQMRQQW